MKLRKRGFSLTELLCVIAIISILAAIYGHVLVKAFLHAKKVLSQ